MSKKKKVVADRSDIITRPHILQSKATSELYSKAKQKARERGMNMSEYIRYVINKDLDSDSVSN